AGKLDSSRYYFKLSGNVGYGLESFRYSGSHGYQHYEHNYSYRYSASVKNSKQNAGTYVADLKFDIDLPLGIKIVNGLSYNSFSFQTPQYDGSGSDGFSINYTYTVKEKVSMNAIHAFFGLGYGRKIGKVILDADLCLDRYRVSDLVIERAISISGTAGNSGMPSKGAAYQKGEVNGGLGIRGSINVSYQVAGPLYLRAGLVYRSDLSSIKATGYSGYENIHSDFASARAYLFNLGFSFSVR
ncbi:MAG: hypothetical protein O9353_13385, partial [Bacteroidia bacterium]|nr:hypothetical protein [Bacteroidia bacterium]